jgi:hypothetical protein
MKRYGNRKGVRHDFKRRISHSIAVFREAVGEDLHTLIEGQRQLRDHVAELRIDLRDFRSDEKSHHAETLTQLKRLEIADGIFQ